MKNGYEYHYLFGLDIPLEQYGLGRIKQLKIIDYLSKDVNIDGFYMPFVMNDILISQLDNKDVAHQLKEQMGSLTFLMTNCMNANKIEYISMLIECLKVLYRTDKVELGNNISIVIDNKIRVNDSNFDVLCNVVLESLKIDKSKMKFDKQEDKKSDLITDEMLEAKRRFLERNKGKKKDEGLSVADISNLIIHSGLFKYEDVLNMTIYQLKNSYEVINRKESFEINMLHRISPKFDMSKEKYEHWSEKIKLDKSTLSQNG